MNTCFFTHDIMPRYFFYSSITFLVSTYSCLAESIYRQDLECLTKNKSYTKSIKILADEACNAFEKFEITKSDRALRILLYTLSCGKAPLEVGVPKALLSFQGIGGGATYCDYQIVTWILEKTYNMSKESFNWINQYGENADFINFYKRYLDIVNYKISKEELEKAIKIVQQKKEEERNKKEEEKKKKRESEEKKRKEEEDRNRKEEEKFFKTFNNQDISKSFLKFIENNYYKSKSNIIQKQLIYKFIQQYNTENYPLECKKLLNLFNIKMQDKSIKSKEYYQQFSDIIFASYILTNNKNVSYDSDILTYLKEIKGFFDSKKHKNDITDLLYKILMLRLDKPVNSLSKEIKLLKSSNKIYSLEDEYYYEFKRIDEEYFKYIWLILKFLYNEESEDKLIDEFLLLYDQKKENKDELSMLLIAIYDISRYGKNNSGFSKKVLELLKKKGFSAQNSLQDKMVKKIDKSIK